MDSKGVASRLCCLEKSALCLGFGFFSPVAAIPRDQACPRCSAKILVQESVQVLPGSEVLNPKL